MRASAVSCSTSPTRATRNCSKRCWRPPTSRSRARDRARSRSSGSTPRRSWRRARGASGSASPATAAATPRPDASRSATTPRWPRRRARGRRRRRAAVLRGCDRGSAHRTARRARGVGCWRAGGGALLDLSLCGVTAHALAFAPTGEFEVGSADAPDRASARGHRARERAQVAQRAEGERSPDGRRRRPPARAPGADTEALRRELSC